QRNARAAGYADAIEAWVESDVVNLGEFRDGQFDAVVCYGGPLSYVFDQRERALRELLRVTRQDGLLFLSVRSLWGSIHKGFPSMLQHDPRFFREVVRTGDLGPDKVAVTGSF
ncbi:MAG: class I SAM-dependent methyltransferase, partial [Chloroflexi bacterium]|nr:class I SAM-dependent methyltransferase [Chloroflexota bacterium]